MAHLFTAVKHSTTGWPDRAIFRLFGDCLVRAFFILQKSPKNLGEFFHAKSYVLNATKMGLATFCAIFFPQTHLPNLRLDHFSWTGATPVWPDVLDKTSPHHCPKIAQNCALLNETFCQRNLVDNNAINLTKRSKLVSFYVRWILGDSLKKLLSHHWTFLCSKKYCPMTKNIAQMSNLRPIW
jgi:hypothetical protein